MTFEEAKALLGNISYKPHYSLRLTRLLSDDCILLEVKHCELDSTGKDVGSINLLSGTAITEATLSRLTGDRFILWIRETLLVTEVHELDEWYKIKGKCYRDPHSELGHALNNTSEGAIA